MSLKRITLNFAERNVASLALARVPKADLETARQVREIRRRLDLRQAIKALDKLNEKGGEFGVGVTWEDLADDLAPFVERIDALVTEEKVEAERDKLEALKKRAQDATGAREFTIDDAYLKWLRDELFADLDLSKAKMQDRSGIAHDIDLIVPLAQLEVYAELADAVADAIAAKSVREEKTKATT